MNALRAGPPSIPANTLAASAPALQAAVSVSLERKVLALSSPQTYPQPTSRVSWIETHFAWVFLTDDFAYKMKKPVVLGAMDLGLLEMRARNCAEEVRLNRRLAPDVYLGVLPLTLERDGRLAVDGDGSVADWLVKMRRLREHDMLDCAIATGTVNPNALHAVGRMLASFYERQAGIAFAAGEYRARLAGQIDADRRALADARLALSQARVRLLIDEQLAALELLAAELGTRAASARIVEAHGDLRPEHICLSEPPCVIDALEFSFDLRTLDSLEELAFLFIECEQAGAAWAGAAVLEACRSELRDAFTPALWNFYCSRRATVRAKIIAWHMLDEKLREVAPWSERAELYISRALHYIQAAVQSARADVAIAPTT